MERKRVGAMTIAFADMDVSYDKFVNDIASRMVAIMKEETEKPEFVSQREASRLFGRANVERWRRTGMIQPVKRPGKMEYRISELRLLQSTEQDCLQVRKIVNMNRFYKG